MNKLSTQLQDAHHRLMTHSDSPDLDAQLLMQKVLNVAKSYLYTHPEYQLTSAQLQAYATLVAQRCNGTPIAYLTGYKEFWSLPLKVTTATLIPRPETELLVEMTLKLLDDTPDAQILELGTGCGAIALALAQERPQWHILATDISEEALAVARDNAATLQLKNIKFVLSHWFAELPKQRFHAIVSNPPYLAADVLRLRFWTLIKPSL